MSEDRRAKSQRGGKKRRRGGRQRRGRGGTGARSEPTLHQIVKRLSERLRADADPAALQGGAAGGYVEVSVRLPLEPAARADIEVKLLEERLKAAREDLLAKNTVFSSGRVFCLRCASTDCKHAVPPSERSVFAGYSPTGLPRFAEWPELLLERRDDRLDEVHERPARFVARVATPDELVGSVLDVYRSDLGFRLWGQVDAGWFTSPRTGDADRQALSLQILSLKSPGRPWRFGLNAVGVAPGGEPLETRVDQWEVLPWTEAVRWCRGLLGDIERKANAQLDSTSWQPRAEGLAAALARRLEKASRATQRKTVHARERQRQQRPTGMALSDLRTAGSDRILFDTKYETLIVLGDKGRAHAFLPDGRLVTSVRYTPASIQRRRNNGRWRPAKDEEVAQLQRSAAAPPASR